ncbi:hypothetical protein [uncultured Ottowia sp.]|uniref:hypothetical protein n=1 Tax=uncultured Ottowia sp. TaxID=543067 RepID=UPI0025960D32|nr:hypothetical protein [uncultured Ottowia sp.]
MKKGCLKAALFFSSRPAIQRSQTITRAGMAKRQTHQWHLSGSNFAPLFIAIRPSQMGASAFLACPNSLLFLIIHPAAAAALPDPPRSPAFFS